MLAVAWSTNRECDAEPSAGLDRNRCHVRGRTQESIDNDLWAEHDHGKQSSPGHGHPDAIAQCSPERERVRVLENCRLVSLQEEPKRA